MFLRLLRNLLASTRTGTAYRLPGYFSSTFATLLGEAWALVVSMWRGDGFQDSRFKGRKAFQNESIVGIVFNGCLNGLG